MTHSEGSSPTPRCEEPGCVGPLHTVVGIGPRLLGRQRLDHVSLVCVAHATQTGRRRLFHLSINEWLRTDLRPFQRRWCRPDDFRDYVSAQLAGDM